MANPVLVEVMHGDRVESRRRGAAYIRGRYRRAILCRRHRAVLYPRHYGDEGRSAGQAGAEGIFCGTVPNAGLGIAIKCNDGATRAAETVMANLLLALVRSDNATLKHWANPLLHNRGGIAIGENRLAKGALAGLCGL